MSALRLLIVRHGVTDWNREGRFQGHLDPPLADDGRREAELVAARVAEDADLRPGRIVSSSLARAIGTADAIATATGATLQPDARLIEIGQGEWEGRTHAELAIEDADRYRAWRTATGIRRPPGGESAASTANRVRTLLDEIEGDPDESPVCLVSHGGTIRVLASLLFGLPRLRGWALDVDNAALSVATRTAGSWRLDRWNDTRHLLGLEETHVDEAEGRPLAL